MRVVGIDPGLTGALALLDDEGGLDVLVVQDMPTLPTGTGKALVSPTSCADILKAFAPDVIWIERVSAMPKQGVTSSFNFGYSFGIIFGVVGTLKLPYHLVTPREWKNHFRLGADKKAARATASRLFPHHASLFARVKDDGRAEAALIAHFGATRTR